MIKIDFTSLPTSLALPGTDAVGQKDEVPRPAPVDVFDHAPWPSFDDRVPAVEAEEEDLRFVPLEREPELQQQLEEMLEPPPVRPRLTRDSYVSALQRFAAIVGAQPADDDGTVSADALLRAVDESGDPMAPAMAAAVRAAVHFLTPRKKHASLDMSLPVLLRNRNPRLFDEPITRIDRSELTEALDRGPEWVRSLIKREDPTYENLIMARDRSTRRRDDLQQANSPVALHEAVAGALVWQPEGVHQAAMRGARHARQRLANCLNLWSWAERAALTHAEPEGQAALFCHIVRRGLPQALDRVEWNDWFPGYRNQILDSLVEIEIAGVRRLPVLGVRLSRAKDHLDLDDVKALVGCDDLAQFVRDSQREIERRVGTSSVGSAAGFVS